MVLEALASFTPQVLGQWQGLATVISFILILIIMFLVSRENVSAGIIAGGITALALTTAGWISLPLSIPLMIIIAGILTIIAEGR